MARECLRQRRRRRNRIPRRDSRAAINASERGGAVAFDEDPLADGVRTLDPDPQRIIEIVLGVDASHVHRVHVGFEQRLLALVLLADQLCDFFRVDIEQRGKRADVDDVLEQLALARVGVLPVADFRQRNADDGDVVAELRCRERLGRVIKQISAGLDFLQVLIPGLRVHRHHEVDAPAPAAPARFADPYLEPGGQALNIGWKDVSRRHGDAHAQNGLGEEQVRRRRA